MNVILIAFPLTNSKGHYSNQMDQRRYGLLYFPPHKQLSHMEVISIFVCVCHTSLEIKLRGHCLYGQILTLCQHRSAKWIRKNSHLHTVKHYFFFLYFLSAREKLFCGLSMYNINGFWENRCMLKP